MTPLQALASLPDHQIARLGIPSPMSGPRGANAFDNRPAWDNKSGGGTFDNRPAWDNWSKK